MFGSHTEMWYPILYPSSLTNSLSLSASFFQTGQSGGSDLFNSATLNHDSLADAGNSHQQEIRLTQPGK